MNPITGRQGIEMRTMNETLTQPADALVIFGITGDLGRKMTFRSLYRLELGRQLNCPVIGIAKDDWSKDHLIETMRKALEASGEVVDERAFRRLARRFKYLQGDFVDPDTYARLAEALPGSRTQL